MKPPAPSNPFSRPWLRRVALHTGFIAASLALGLMLRSVWRKPSASFVGTRPSPTATSPKKSHGPSLPAPDGIPSLDTAALIAEWKSSAASPGSFLDAFQLSQKSLHLLRRARTTKDFEGLVDLLNALAELPQEPSGLPIPILDLVFERWASLDPASATRGVSRLVNRRDQFTALTTTVKSWVKQDGAAALAGVQAIPGLSAGHGPGFVLDAMAKDSPAEALEFYRTHFKEDDFDRGHAIFQQWARRDPKAVADWIAGESPGNQPASSREMEAALTALSAENPAKAWELGERLVTGSAALSNTRRQLLPNWLRADAPAAIAAVGGISDPATRASLFNYLGEQSSLRDPSPRQDWLEKMPDETARQAFLSGTASSLARGDNQPESFQTAATIAATLTDPKARDSVFREIGSYWVKADAPAASRWLDAQPPGPDRDAAIGEFVRSLVQTDPAAALIWSAAISDPGKRTRRLTELYPQWYKTDPVRAEAWSAGLEVGTQKQLEAALAAAGTGTVSAK